MMESKEEKYRRMVENANEGIFVAQDWVFKFCNPKASEILGYSPAELAVKPFVEIVYPDDRPMLAKRHKRRLKGESLVDMYSFRFIHKHGDLRWAEIKPVMMIWEGKPATLNFMSDITSRKQEEAKRRQLEDQLHHAQKMEAIGALAGGIAHDFNNILGAITGYTELSIQDLHGSSVIRDNLEQVLAASNRAKELVRQILTFSRKGHREPKPVYIKQLVEEAAKLLRSSLPATIELILTAAPGLSPVLADPTRIHQVIMNLCTNAAHAMRKRGGMLEIKLDEFPLNGIDIQGLALEPGMYQRVTICDTGHGMDEAVRRRIFEPYFTTKQEGEGTGLGLAVVHGIVISHGGDIRVSSEPDKGTCFEIYLPVTEEPEASGKPVESKFIGGSERILFVDDEEMLASLGRQALERLGYSTTIATSSLEALNIFAQAPHAFDIVITDQTMPQMTGLQLTSRIRELRPDIPVIICTGHSENIDEENFKAHGIDGFVLKPIVIREIARMVRQILDGN